MGDEDLERFETDVELQIYREYRDVLPGLFGGRDVGRHVAVAYFL